MTFAEVHLRLSPEVLEWLPIVAKGHRDRKEKPDPLSVREWCFDQMRQVSVRFGGPANRLVAKGYLIIQRGQEPYLQRIRLERGELRPEAFRPLPEAPGSNFALEMPPMALDRLVQAVALLHLYLEKGIDNGEQFDTIEQWAATQVTETAADAYTEISNRELADMDLGEEESPPETHGVVSPRKTVLAP